MSNCNEQRDVRFPIQHVGDAYWLRATGINLAADYLAGYRSVVESFVRGKPGLEILGKRLRAWPRAQIQQYVAQGRRESLAFLAMMMTGECNANCSICFTDRKRKRGELTPDERDRLLRQGRALGARYVYIPGEGEPTVDRGFWQLLETCREIGLEAVIFTNGLILSDRGLCQRYWGIEPAEAVKRLSEYPVSFYFKLWSMRPDLVGQMMRIDPRQYHFDEYGGATLPAGLIRMLKDFPRERIGLEAVVERRNAEEIREVIVPFAERHGLARIIELLQHNGRVLDDFSFDPTPEQVEAILPLLSPTSCSMATCKAVVTSRGYLSPRIAVLEDQIPGSPVDARDGDLFESLHQTRYLVEKRYDLGCVCEELPVGLAKARERLKLVSTSIVPPALTTLSMCPINADPAESRFRPDATVASLVTETTGRERVVRVGGRAYRLAGKNFELVDGAQRLDVTMAADAREEPIETSWVGVEGNWEPGARRISSARLVFHRPPRFPLSRAREIGLPEADFVEKPMRVEAVQVRARLLRLIRSFFEERGFIEVQTPFLHSVAEGCFVQQSEVRLADGHVLYLRTDPEEYLKRYLSAGLDAVFEVSTNMRLDPVDETHLQEFTSVECYQRFATLEDSLVICSELVIRALQVLRGSLNTCLRGTPTVFPEVIPVRSFAELVQQHAGLDISRYPSAETLARELRGRGWWQGANGPLDGFRRTWLEWIFEHRVLPALDQPTFVSDFPIEMGLSAMERFPGAGTALRAELYLPGGFELCHLYENITDYEELRARYEQRLRHRLAAGLAEVPLDHGLLGSAALGMPPMAGLALGIDRLLMLILGEGTIGDGLLFPHESTMQPKGAWT